MSDMKYDIPVIVQVSAKNIDEARQVVYKLVEQVSLDSSACVSMADDSTIVSGKRRIVVLHPEDAHANYEEETYSNENEE